MVLRRFAKPQCEILQWRAGRVEPGQVDLSRIFLESGQEPVVGSERQI
jgi:hypothetical protein